MAEFLGSKTISNQFLGNKVILRTYKGDSLINEYEPLYNPPSDWSDIRTDCPEKSIALYAAHPADFSAYNNLGFTATCIGGYNVFIDGVQYGSTYASGAQCDITWSTSGITTGDIITTPTLLKAHKILVEPATEGNNITKFQCKRVAASGTEAQGVLWAHFNLTNEIMLEEMLYNDVTNTLCEAITAKGDKINLTSIYGWASGIYNAFTNCSSLEYVPSFNTINETRTYWQTFKGSKISKITLTQGAANTSSYDLFNDCQQLQQIKGNFTIQPTERTFKNCLSLKILPTLDATNSTNMDEFLTNAVALEDTVLDVSAATGLTKIGCYGSNTYFMQGFKGLRVSNEAPFNNATSPQINVSYTGMDRSALVQLFNDLPYNIGYTVVGSPTISSGGVVSNFSTSDYLTLPTIDLSQPFEIMFKIKTPASWGTAYDIVLAASSNIRYTFQKRGPDRQFSYYVPDENGTSRTQHDGKTGLLENTVYYVRTRFTGTKLIIDRSTDKENWTEEYSEDRTVGFFSSSYVIGRNANLAQQVWTGEVDLSETYIKVNDVYWFRGQPAMTKTLSCVGCLGNQLNTVGSPTISDGIVSVSSNSDIVKTTQSFIYNNNGKYEIYTRFKTPQTLSGVNSVFGKIDIWKTPVLYVTENSLLFRLPDNSELYSGFSNINADTYYRTKIVGDYGVWTIWLYSDSGVQIATASKDISETSAQSSGVLLIDSFYGNSYPVQYVDLNETYIKVNNNTWFDINNCLLPEDRAIVTDKGWSITYQ